MAFADYTRSESVLVLSLGIMGLPSCLLLSPIALQTRLYRLAPSLPFSLHFSMIHSENMGTKHLFHLKALCSTTIYLGFLL